MADAIDRQKALANIANFYREALRRDKAGQDLARSLGLHDGGLLERFQMGYANGSLLKAIPSKGALRDYLREIGLLGADGQETALGCLTLTALDGPVLDANLDAGDYADQTVVNAVPFVTYSIENPSDYATGTYSGLAVIYMPQQGFEHINYNLVITELIAQ